MAKVLYITAHPHDEATSYSMATGKAFIESYKEANPNDEVVHIDLYKENIPHIDADVFSGWGKLQSGTGFEELSDSEKQKSAVWESLATNLHLLISTYSLLLYGTSHSRQ